MKNKNFVEKDEKKNKNENITVQLLNIAGDVKKFEDVKFIKIKSQKYNLIIMKDYLPIIGEIQGEIQIGREKENIEMKRVRGYFMHKHNKFNLFYSE